MMAQAPAIIAISPSMRSVLALAQRFAKSGLSILLLGETGTGKELVAQGIHEWSERGGPLVDVNCGALPSEMVESLLFGHRRGAFTGAHATVDGLVAAADKGTLFLDELSSLSLEAQAKLLRVLETGEIRPLGGVRKQALDLRVIAAAQGDLRQRVCAGGFRLDLFQRLGGVVLELPPLRERAEDAVPLAEHFAERMGRALHPGVGALIAAHHWPGNVRELRLAVERAAWLSGAGEISGQLFSESLRLGAGTVEPVDDRARVIAACQAAGWDVAAAAQSLGVGRTTLYARMRELGITPEMRPLSLPSGRRRTSPDETGARPTHPPTEVIALERLRG